MSSWGSQPTGQQSSEAWAARPPPLWQQLAPPPSQQLQSNLSQQPQQQMLQQQMLQQQMLQQQQLQTAAAAHQQQLLHQSYYPQLPAPLEPSLTRGFTAIKHGRGGNSTVRSLWFTGGGSRLCWSSDKPSALLFHGGTRSVSLSQVTAIVRGVDSPVLRRLVAHGHILNEARVVTLVLPRRTVDLEAATEADAAALAATLARFADAARGGSARPGVNPGAFP